MTAQDLYEAGKLAEAIQAALNEVKGKPTDVSLRYRLILLLCYNGDLEKADRQLTMLAKQQPDAAVGTTLLRQLIRGELSRQECHHAGRVPEFLGEPNDVLKLHLKAAICLREGKSGEAAELLAEAESERPKISGNCDGSEFDDVRDLDDVLAPVVEALTSTGKYFWVPLSDVTSLEMQKPDSLADLIWRPMRLTVRNEAPGAVYLPTLYVDSSKDDKESIRLGRETEWLGLDEPPVRGRGLRMWLLGDEARTILEIEKLELNTSHSETDKVGAESGDG